MARARTTVIAALAAALMSSACSDGDGKESDPEPTPAPDSTAVSTADAEAAVAGFYEDLAAGELGSACEWWTDEYAASSIAEWNEGGYGPQVASCRELLRAIREVFAIVGDPSDLLQATDVSGELTDDTSARVDVMLASDEDEHETYQLTLTDDGWRISGDDSE